MARIHDTISLGAGSVMPSLGSLLGSRASSEVFSAVHDMGHSSFFGSEFDQRRNEFFMRYVQPMDQVGVNISGMVNQLLNPDQFRSLTSIEDLRSIPPCMEVAIAMFAPIRQGIMEGRFEGFGFDPSTLPVEDSFGRLIDNNRVTDVAAVMDDNGYYPITAEFYTDDPNVSEEDLEHLRMTREYMLEVVLRQTQRDPTSIDLPRG